MAQQSVVESISGAGSFPRTVPHADDADLLAGMARRDADALAELYDRYGRTVFAVLYRMLPSESRIRLGMLKLRASLVASDGATTLS